MFVQAQNQASIDALRNPRFELVPIKGVFEQAAHLPLGATITLTCSPTQGNERTIDVAEQISQLGYRVVPHISARLVTSEQHLDEVVSRLNQMNVQEIFVIGGDARAVVGPYESAGSLLAALQKRGHAFTEIGVGGYPEGHPLIDQATLWDELQQKQTCATYIVTQMCFDSHAVTKWVADARARGISLPVVIGIPGVVNLRHLLRTATRIGVGQSTRFLQKNLGMLSNFFRPGAYRPDDLLTELSPYLAESDYDIRGFHLYTFNNAEQTDAWRRKLLAGDA